MRKHRRQVLISQKKFKSRKGVALIPHWLVKALSYAKILRAQHAYNHVKIQFPIVVLPQCLSPAYVNNS